MPNRYLAIEVQNESAFSQLPTYSTKEQLDIEKRIYQGVFSLTKEQQNQSFDFVKFNLH